jgi:nicotinate phosphoribosyltransferase
MSDGEDFALLTDFYQLTMAQSYFQAGKREPATFSLFVRSYPRDRGYFVACGLADVLNFLDRLSFDAAAIDYLRARKLFDEEFLEVLQGLRFTGDVWAIPEGRLFFADEPILEVTAPIIEAQLVETFIINQVNFQSLIASKAARCLYAAAGRGVVDFSLRRTHGTDAGMKVARASYLAGFAGTSNVRAGHRYDIPVVGTMAHSFVLSFEREIDSFRAFVGSFPQNSTLLIDTYDTIAGADNAVAIAGEMALRGQRLQGVRIDSGDLLALAREVREILDRAGLHDVKIIGSGGLDEYDLSDLSAARAPFDSYGVGTRMGVSADAPWLDIAYKLVEHGNRPVMKLSPGKVSWPGRKQVFRRYDSERRLKGDLIGLRSEQMDGAEPLLQKVMEHGKLTKPAASLESSRRIFREEFSRLAEPIKAIREPERYPVDFTPRLRALHDQVTAKIKSTI